MTQRYYNPETNRFDMAAIMRDAWAGMKRNNVRVRLSLRLSVIWAEAKAEKRQSEQTPAQNNSDALAQQATLIELKTHISSRQMAEAKDMRSQARQMVA